MIDDLPARDLIDHYLTTLTGLPFRPVLVGKEFTRPGETVLSFKVRSLSKEGIVWPPGHEHEESDTNASSDHVDVVQFDWNRLFFNPGSNWPAALNDLIMYVRQYSTPVLRDLYGTLVRDQVTHLSGFHITDISWVGGPRLDGWPMQWTKATCKPWEAYPEKPGCFIQLRHPRDRARPDLAWAGMSHIDVGRALVIRDPLMWVIDEMRELIHSVE